MSYKRPAMPDRTEDGDDVVIKSREECGHGGCVVKRLLILNYFIFYKYQCIIVKAIYIMYVLNNSTKLCVHSRYDGNV